MDFSAFDKSKQETYAAEAKKRWGKTDAYKEFEAKTAGQTREQQNAAGDGLMAIFARMGTIRTTDPGSPEAQALVKELQDYITAHYYTCTKQILRGLGQMYIAGDEMTENIDRSGGAGTADFAVVDAQLAKSYVGKGDYADLKILDDLSSDVEFYAIGFKKGSDLTAKVNAELEKLAADGTIATLAEKYGVSNTAITDFADQK